MSKVYTFNVRTQQATAMIDITRQVQEAVSESKVENGICVSIHPHTTAAITINENADPDVVRIFL